MAFTDVEMAILSQLAYYKMPDGSKKKDLFTYLMENDGKYVNQLTEDLGINYLGAILDFLDKIKNKDYIIVQSMNDRDGTGFAAFAVADPDGNVTVACRGTEGFSMDYDSRKDVYADLQLAYTLQSDQQKKMKEFVEALQRGNYNNYYFTGHSLGGNLAMYGAICLEDPSKLGGVVTFNAPGFNSAFWIEYGEVLAMIQSRFTSYQNECDGISNSFQVPGNIVILECDGWDIFNVDGIQGHYLSKLIVSKDGKSFKRNHTGVKDFTLIGGIFGGVTALTDIALLLLLPGLGLYDSFAWAIGKFAEWVRSASPGGRMAEKNPQVVVDTFRMRDYEGRLQSINGRLSALDSRIDSLYWKVGLADLWNLMRGDFKISWSYRIDRCRIYLNETATEYERIESELLKNL